jgi:FkbM family methyltransferase
MHWTAAGDRGGFLTAKDITDTHIAMQLFPGYTDADTAIFAEFRNSEAKPEPGFIVDFLGSRTRTSSLWREARRLDGHLIGIPVPGDFHAEAIEWIGLLKAVRSAVGQYVAMELGAGFGPWTVAGAVAARQRRIRDIRLCAVEGDPHHFQSLRQHLIDNGFDPERHTLLQAVVGVRAGVAQWPAVDDSTEPNDWGCRPMQASRDYRGREFLKTKPIEVVPMLDLIVREPRWDLIHMDVQGDEAALCRSCIDELTARVKRITSATHSRKIEGDLLDLMSGAGWLLEHEKPARFNFVPDAASLEAMTTMDGTQVWRNPRIIDVGDPLSSFSQEISSTAREFRARPGEVVNIEIIARNTGVQPWFGRAQSAPVNAGYRWFDISGNQLPIEGNRAQLNSLVVRPGESDRLVLQIETPPDPGSYVLWISMVQEGVAWFYAKGANPLVLSAEVGGARP